jgi:hypothetical protein
MYDQIYGSIFAICGSMLRIYVCWLGISDIMATCLGSMVRFVLVSPILRIILKVGRVD